MCNQTISIAVCAPQNPPELSVTCGRLHLFSKSTEICGNAAGSCRCFLGTCGTLEKITSATSIELRDLPKVRCLECTHKQDQIGIKRTAKEFIESALLEKFPTSAGELEQYKTTLLAFWGSETCTFNHRPVGTKPPMTQTRESQPKEATAKATDDSTPNRGVWKNKSPDVQAVSAPKPTVRLPPQSPASPKANQTLSEQSKTPTKSTNSGGGLERSRWAPASREPNPKASSAKSGELVQSRGPDRSQESNARAGSTKSSGIEQSRWAPSPQESAAKAGGVKPGNGFERSQAMPSSRGSPAKTKSVKSGNGLEQSRWAPGSQKQKAKVAPKTTGESQTQKTPTDTKATAESDKHNDPIELGQETAEELDKQEAPVDLKTTKETDGPQRPKQVETPGATGVPELAAAKEFLKLA